MPRPDDETFRYIARVNAIPPLDREQELALARAFRDEGDREAGRRVIRANLRNVVPHALRHRNLGLPLSELIAQGNLALCDALRRFEPERGLRFATYANYWIRAEILGVILRSRSLVGGGRGPLRSKFVFRMRKEHARLVTQHGESPEVVSILAERFGKTPNEIRYILARLEARDASLDVKVGSESSVSLLDTLTDGAEEAVEERLHTARSREQLVEAVVHATSDLDTRQRFILERRLMADADRRMSLSEIGRRFGVSRERARQLEHALKKRLRTRLSPVYGELELGTAA